MKAIQHAAHSVPSCCAHGRPRKSPKARKLTSFGSESAAGKPRPAEKGGNTEMYVIPAPLTMVTALGAMRVTMPEDLRPAENRRAVLNMLRVRCSSFVHTPRFQISQSKDQTRLYHDCMLFVHTQVFSYGHAASAHTCGFCHIGLEADTLTCSCRPC